MGAALKNDDEPLDDASIQPRGFVDFILARASSDGISTRKLSLQTGIRRGRLHNVLHRNASKRHPMRIDEIQAVLRALRIDSLEAALATELLDANVAVDDLGVRQIVALISEVVRGLPTQIAEVVDHIDGLEYSDVRKEHGKRLQAAMIAIIKDQYTEMVRRREFRVDASKY